MIYLSARSISLSYLYFRWYITSFGVRHLWKINKYQQKELYVVKTNYNSRPVLPKIQRTLYNCQSSEFENTWSTYCHWFDIHLLKLHVNFAILIYLVFIWIASNVLLGRRTTFTSKLDLITAQFHLCYYKNILAAFTEMKLSKETYHVKWYLGKF